MEFGKRLRQLREKRCLTMAQLAEALNMSTSIIGSYENGERFPKIKTLGNIATFFGVTTDYLLCKDDNSSSEFSDILKNLIKERGLTYKEFAEELDIDWEYMQHILDGAKPDFKIAKRMADYLNVPMSRITHTTYTQEYGILDFLIKTENIEYIELAMEIKEKGLLEKVKKMIEIL